MILLYYKCRWCGEMFSNSVLEGEVAVVEKYVVNCCAFGVRQVATHLCNPPSVGHYGVGDFIGAQEVEEVKP